MFLTTFTSPLWLLRLSWLALAVFAAPSIGDALADRSRAVQVTATTIAWVVWSAGLVATAVPRAVTLTAIRLVAPAAAVGTVWAALGADRTGWAVAGITAGVLATGMALVGPGVSDAFVDGSSYGEERRVSLRIPPALLLGPLPVAWGVAAAGVVTGPLLIAADRLAIGVVAGLLGTAVAVLIARRVHALSRRWLVFVPAGLVVHDPLRLTDPVLFLRRQMVSVTGADPAGSDALDLTGGAWGLVLEVRGREPVTLGVREGRSTDEVDGVTAVWVAPVRPGAALEAARTHRLPVHS